MNQMLCSATVAERQRDTGDWDLAYDQACINDLLEAAGNAGHGSSERENSALNLLMDSIVNSESFPDLLSFAAGAAPDEKLDAMVGKRLRLLVTQQAADLVHADCWRVAE